MGKNRPVDNACKSLDKINKNNKQQKEREDIPKVRWATINDRYIFDKNKSSTGK